MSFWIFGKNKKAEKEVYEGEFLKVQAALIDMEKRLSSLEEAVGTQAAGIVKRVVEQLETKLNGIDKQYNLFNAKQQAALKKLLNKNKARIQLLKKKVAA